ncbi:hypothetical protein Vretifemale_14367 [Volvox reticuliferus]|uniref:Uncharacterized protein n=1 Tax=Volvox reticuliferus TaxID=1737510 RepID=A0A8J4CLW3_9CHLO|nr:hypothetical protein Vretifemale_14367 [Volvox reticuliferus]
MMTSAWDAPSRPSDLLLLPKACSAEAKQPEEYSMHAMAPLSVPESAAGSQDGDVLRRNALISTCLTWQKRRRCRCSPAHVPELEVQTLQVDWGSPAASLRRHGLTVDVGLRIMAAS